MILPHAKQRQLNIVRHQSTSKEVVLVRLTNKKESKVMQENSPIKILVVEDTEICQKLASYMFCQPDYLTDIVGTGQEALDKYSQGYDVILLDLGLPDISGIEVCRHIREKIGDKNIPIIAYSAISDTLHQECVDAGFNETLMKPTGKKILEKVIKKLVQK